jgi:predicted RNase H-like HicB family nuclease
VTSGLRFTVSFDEKGGYVASHPELPTITALTAFLDIART